MSACCFTRSANEPASAISHSFVRLWQNPKTKSGLKKVPVACQDVHDLQLLHDSHACYVRKGNVRLVSKCQAQIKCLPEPRGRDFLRRYEGRVQEATCEPRRFLEGAAANQQRKRLV